MIKIISRVLLAFVLLSVVASATKLRKLQQDSECTLSISNGWAGVFLHPITPGVPTFNSGWQNLKQARDYDIDSDCECLFTAFAKNTFDGKYSVIKLHKGKRAKAPYNSVNYMVVCSSKTGTNVYTN